MGLPGVSDSDLALLHLDRGLAPDKVPVQLGSITPTHSIPLQDLQEIEARRRQGGLHMRNATCPAVARVQARVPRHGSKGEFTIILGHQEHPEVVAHCSDAAGGYAVIQTLEEALGLADEYLEGALVVAQTTFSIDEYRRIVVSLRSRSGQIRIRETICPDNYQRQEEAALLTRKVDGVIVAGGRSSNHTRHLVEVARESGKPVLWVEHSEEIEWKALEGLESIGLLAGASTPTWIVEEVRDALETSGTTSWKNTLSRFVTTLQLPFALAFGILAALLQHALGWHAGWRGALLAPLFHVAFCAGSPFFDPLGLDAKGASQARFLARFRGTVLGIATLSSILTVPAASSMGPGVLAGTLFLATAAMGYHTINPAGRGSRLRQAPALKDLGAATVAALLGVLPGAERGGMQGPRRTMAAFALLFCAALAFQAYRHLRAFREDRIQGWEILSVAIGCRATRWVIAGLLVACLAGLASLLPGRGPAEGAPRGFSGSPGGCPGAPGGPAGG